MSVAPNFDSVYTPEYWGEVPPMYPYEKRGGLRRVFERGRAVELGHGKIPNPETSGNIQEALGRVAVQIFNGDYPEPIEHGEIIGGPDDFKYVVPGNIVLIDTEKVVFNPHLQSNPAMGKNIRNEFELSASPIRLLKAGFERETTIDIEPMHESYPEPVRLFLKLVSKAMRLPTETYKEELDDPCIVYNNYKRSHLNLGVGRYERTVDLVAFFSAETKRGNIGSRVADKSYIHDSGYINTWLDSSLSHEIGKVGETRNESWSNNVLILGRTRSAYVCARGAFEEVTVPVESKSKSRVGRLALSP